MKVRQASGLDYGFTDDGSLILILLDTRGLPFATATVDEEGADELAEFIDLHGLDYIGDVAGHA